MNSNGKYTDNIEDYLEKSTEVVKSIKKDINIYILSIIQ